MKKLTLLLAFLLPVLCVSAQEFWKVKLNNKTLVSTNIMDEKQHVKKVSRTEWKKSGYLEATYTMLEPLQEGWIRSYYLIDEKGNELMQIDSTHKIKISLKKLRNTFAGKKQIQIYTMARPTDPEVAMRVRIRRVHLCTLELP